MTGAGGTPRPSEVPGPDGPEQIQAPWRADYLEEVGRSESRGTEHAHHNFLSRYWEDPSSDERHHVLMRDGHGMVLLNAYPYSSGHLLVALGEPRPRLLEYAPEQRAALWSLVDRAVALCERAIEPQGVNIGVNQGRAAGAGVPGHLHVHVVPRWAGDVNFITTVGRVRVIPAALESMARRYRACLESCGGDPVAV
ncbi:MAG: HIT domain-containing protein [Planctomycetota bacterium]